MATKKTANTSSKRKAAEAPTIYENSYAGQLLKMVDASRERTREHLAKPENNRANWWTYLHHMVDRENLAEIDDELENGQDINVPTGDRHKFSPLHFAAMRGKSKAAKHLIERGADLNCGDAAGSTPLMIAINFKKDDIAYMLLEAGADVRITNKGGADALTWAREIKNSEIELAIRRAGLQKIAGTDHEEPPPPKI